jgi:hypothetical protein
MRVWRFIAAGLIAGNLSLSGQSGQGLLMEPSRDSGASVTGTFEGWFKNADGTFSLLLGYYNRNRTEEVDVPIGPNNRIEPGGPDRGQPTHFVPGRNWGMFVIKVPADFGENKLTWTLVANGQTTVIPASLKTDWEISPFREASVGNTPPLLSFSESGPTAQGPLSIMVERNARVGAPLALPVWVSDDAKYTSNSGARPKNLPPPVRLRWVVYRAPAPVSILDDRPAVAKIDKPDVAFAGTAETSATFNEPGEYMLHVTANDYSGEGGGGFQCCWTTARVKVNVSK